MLKLNVKPFIRNIIELYKDRKIANITTAENMLLQLRTIDPWTKKKTLKRYEKIVAKYEHKEPVHIRMKATREKNIEKVAVKKNTAAGKANDAVLATTKTSMDALTKAGKTLSPEYQQLLIDKKLLEDAGRKEGLSYAEITGRMKDMEDATTNYVDNSMSLKTTAGVAQDLTDKLNRAKNI